MGQCIIPDGIIFGLTQSKFPAGLHIRTLLAQCSSQRRRQLSVNQELHVGCKMA